MHRQSVRITVNLSDRAEHDVLRKNGTSRRYHNVAFTDPAALRHELEEVRSNGYAVDNMEHEFGIRCVAVPVFGSSGQVMAAVSVSGPSPRFDPETVIRHARLIAEILQPLQHQL